MYSTLDGAVSCSQSKSNLELDMVDQVQSVLGPLEKQDKSCCKSCFRRIGFIVTAARGRENPSKSNSFFFTSRKTYSIFKYTEYFYLFQVFIFSSPHEREYIQIIIPFKKIFEGFHIIFKSKISGTCAFMMCVGYWGCLDSV